MTDPLPSLLTMISSPGVEAGVSNYWVVVVVCLVACAFFSGIEIAFLSANKLRIELRSKQGNFSAKILARYTKTPSDFISTVLVANNLALVIYGIYMGKILENAIDGWVHSATLRFLFITLVSTLIVLVTAEFIPKTLFRLNPDRLLSALALPFRFFHLLLWPLIFVVKKISGLVLRIFTKTTITETTPVFTKVDLDNYISTLEHSSDVQGTDLDTEVFRNALDFREVKVRDFMVPRPELVGADINESIDALRKQFIDTRLSRILIYRDNIDHIIGFVHHSEMLDFPSTISQVLKPVLIVNESMQAHDLLRDFIQKRRSIAVVVDEFGGTAGIATIEDVIEEIFGEIEDEFDGEQLTEKELNKNHYLLSTRHEIYYLNEKYEFNIPEGDYNTLGGFVLFICEKIPHVREVIRQGRFEFVITKAKGARIEEVELILHDNEE